MAEDDLRERLVALEKTAKQLAREIKQMQVALGITEPDIKPISWPRLFPTCTPATLSS
jgi:hypothetical protein